MDDSLKLNESDLSSMDIELLEEKLAQSDPLLLKILSIVSSTSIKVTQTNDKLSSHDARTKILENEVSMLRESLETMQNELATFRKQTRADNIILHGVEDMADKNKTLRESTLRILQKINKFICNENI